MSISLRLNEEDSHLIREYAAMHGISVSELFRQAVLEKIENEFDLKAYEQAMSEFRQDSRTFTLDEVKKELGLD